jgi:hypothetical protein
MARRPIWTEEMVATATVKAVGLATPAMFLRRALPQMIAAAMEQQTMLTARMVVCAVAMMGGPERIARFLVRAMQNKIALPMDQQMTKIFQTTVTVSVTNTGAVMTVPSQTSASQTSTAMDMLFWTGLLTLTMAASASVLMVGLARAALYLHLALMPIAAAMAQQAMLTGEMVAIAHATMGGPVTSATREAIWGQILCAGVIENVQVAQRNSTRATLQVPTTVTGEVVQTRSACIRAQRTRLALAVATTMVHCSMARSMSKEML